MKAIDILKPSTRCLFHTLRLTPMHTVLRRLKQYGMNPENMDALEVFGCDGEHHTRDIASVVANLEIWEIGSRYEAILKRRFPKSKIRITDSYLEIERTPKKFDLVVVDNTDVAGGHYEHFDLFPSLFRVLKDPAVIVLNAFTRLPPVDAERMRQRQVFYRVTNGADVTLNEIGGTYRALAAQNGWTVDRLFFQKRATFSLRYVKYFYAVLVLKRAFRG